MIPSKPPTQQSSSRQPYTRLDAYTTPKRPSYDEPTTNHALPPRRVIQLTDDETVQLQLRVLELMEARQRTAFEAKLFDEYVADITAQQKRVQAWIASIRSGVRDFMLAESSARDTI